MARLAILASLHLFLVTCGGQHNDAAKDPPQRDQIVQEIMDMHNIVEDEKRADRAEYLNSLIIRQFESIDKQRAVAELERYLGDNDDAVVYWTAMSIGKFGKDAKPALPKLKQVLKIKEKLIGSKTSASGIRLAISRIED